MEGSIAAKLREGAACDYREGEKEEDGGEEVDSGSIWAGAEDALEVDW